MPGLRPPSPVVPPSSLCRPLQLLCRLHQAAYRGDRFLEHGTLLGIEGNLDDPLHALGADHHGNADIEVLDAVLAGEPRGAWEHTLFVAEIGFRHGDRRGGRRIESRAGLQEIDDLAAAAAGALDDGIDALLRRPT